MAAKIDISLELNQIKLRRDLNATLDSIKRQVEQKAITLNIGANKKSIAAFNFRDPATQVGRLGVGLQENIDLLEVLGQQAKRTAVRFVAYQAIANIIFGLRSAFTGALSAIIDFDLGLNRARQILNPLTTDFDKFAKDQINFAKTFKISIKAVQEAQDIFIRQGLEQGDVAKASAAALLLANAAAIETADATDVLTNISRQFGIEQSNLISIADKLVAVESRSAVTVIDLARAFERAGSAAKAVGLNIDQFAGIVTATVSATRLSGNIVGTTLKTIFSRIFRDESIEVLKKVGVEVRQNNGEFRDAFGILQDLSKVFGTLSRAQQINISTIVGGTRQYSTLLALLNNFDTALSATTDSFSSAGAAAQFNRVRVQSLQAGIQSIQNTFTEFAINSKDVFANFLPILDDLTSKLTAVLGVARDVGDTFSLFSGANLRALLTVGAALVTGALRRSEAKGGFFAATPSIAKTPLEIKKELTKRPEAATATAAIREGEKLLALESQLRSAKIQSTEADKDKLRVLELIKKTQNDLRNIQRRANAVVERELKRLTQAEVEANAKIQTFEREKAVLRTNAIVLLQTELDVQRQIIEQAQAGIALEKQKQAPSITVLRGFNAEIRNANASLAALGKVANTSAKKDLGALLKKLQEVTSGEVQNGIITLGNTFNTLKKNANDARNSLAGITDNQKELKKVLSQRAPPTQIQALVGSLITSRQDKVKLKATVQASRESTANLTEQKTILQQVAKSTQLLFDFEQKLNSERAKGVANLELAERALIAVNKATRAGASTAKLITGQQTTSLAQRIAFQPDATKRNVVVSNLKLKKESENNAKSFKIELLSILGLQAGLSALDDLFSKGTSSVAKFGSALVDVGQEATQVALNFSLFGAKLGAVISIIQVGTKLIDFMSNRMDDRLAESSKIAAEQVANLNNAMREFSAQSQSLVQAFASIDTSNMVDAFSKLSEFTDKVRSDFANLAGQELNEAINKLQAATSNADLLKDALNNLKTVIARKTFEKGGGTAALVKDFENARFEADRLFSEIAAGQRIANPGGTESLGESLGRIFSGRLHFSQADNKKRGGFNVLENEQKIVKIQEQLAEKREQILNVVQSLLNTDKSLNANLTEQAGLLDIIHSRNADILRIAQALATRKGFNIFSVPAQEAKNATASTQNFTAALQESDREAIRTATGVQRLIDSANIAGLDIKQLTSFTFEFNNELDNSEAALQRAARILAQFSNTGRSTDEVLKSLRDSLVENGGRFQFVTDEGRVVAASIDGVKESLAITEQGAGLLAKALEGLGKAATVSNASLRQVKAQFIDFKIIIDTLNKSLLTSTQVLEEQNKIFDDIITNSNKTLQIFGEISRVSPFSALRAQLSDIKLLTNLTDSLEGLDELRINITANTSDIENSLSRINTEFGDFLAQGGNINVFELNASIQRIEALSKSAQNLQKIVSTFKFKPGNALSDAINQFFNAEKISNEVNRQAQNIRAAFSLQQILSNLPEGQIGEIDANFENQVRDVANRLGGAFQKALVERFGEKIQISQESTRSLADFFDGLVRRLPQEFATTGAATSKIAGSIISDLLFKGIDPASETERVNLKTALESLTQEAINGAIKIEDARAKIIQQIAASMDVERKAFTELSGAIRSSFEQIGSVVNNNLGALSSPEFLSTLKQVILNVNALSTGITTKLGLPFNATFNTISAAVNSLTSQIDELSQSLKGQLKPGQIAQVKQQLEKAQKDREDLIQLLELQAESVKIVRSALDGLIDASNRTAAATASVITSFDAVSSLQVSFMESLKDLDVSTQLAGLKTIASEQSRAIFSITGNVANRLEELFSTFETQSLRAATAIDASEKQVAQSRADNAKRQIEALQKVSEVRLSNLKRELDLINQQKDAVNSFINSFITSTEQSRQQFLEGIQLAQNIFGPRGPGSIQESIRATFRDLTNDQQVNLIQSLEKLRGTNTQITKNLTSEDIISAFTREVGEALFGKSPLLRLQENIKTLQEDSLREQSLSNSLQLAELKISQQILNISSEGFKSLVQILGQIIQTGDNVAPGLLTGLPEFQKAVQSGFEIINNSVGDFGRNANISAKKTLELSGSTNAVTFSAEKLLSVFNGLPTDLSTTVEKFNELRDELVRARADLLAAERSFTDAKKSLRDAFKNTATAQQQLVVELAKFNIELGKVDLEAGKLRGSFTTLFDEFNFLKKIFDNSTVSAAKLSTANQNLNQQLVRINDRIVSASLSTQQTIFRNESQLRDLRVQFAQEAVTIFRSALDNQRQIGEQFFTSSREQQADFLRGLVAIRGILGTNNIKPGDFQNLSEADINQFGNEILALPQEIRQNIANALSLLPQGATFGGFSKTELENIFFGAAIGADKDAGIPSLEFLTQQIVDFQKVIAEGTASNVENARQQLINSSEQVRLAKEQLQAAKAQVEFQRLTVDLLAAQLAAFRVDTTGGRLATSIGSRGFIPNGALGLSRNETSGLINAAIREKRAMPSGSRLGVFNTSETVLTRHQASHIFGNVPTANRGIINAQNGTPNTIDLTATIDRLNTILDRLANVETEVRDIKITVDNKKNVEIRGVGQLSTELSNLFEEAFANVVTVDEIEPIKRVLFDVILRKLQERGLVNSAQR